MATEKQIKYLRFLIFKLVGGFSEVKYQGWSYILDFLFYDMKLKNTSYYLNELTADEAFSLIQHLLNNHKTWFEIQTSNDPEEGQTYKKLI